MAKVALVTGQSRGLGKAIAAELTALGVVVPTVTREDVDMGNPASVQDFAAWFMGRYGIDILVNNAAILGPVGNIEDCKPADIAEAFAVNFLGPMYLIRETMPRLKRSNGRIVNVLGGGATSPLPRRAVYGAAKAALAALTGSLVGETGESQIALYGLLPGPMGTGMLEEMLAAGPHRLGVWEHADHEGYRDNSVERAAKCCAYLATEAPFWLSGRIISARYDPWPFRDTSMPEDWLTVRRIDEVARKRLVEGKDKRTA